jgi:hypothetical protein
VFNFTVRVRDYHEAGAGLTQSFALDVASSASPQLALSIIGQGTNSQVRLLLMGVAGQQQVIQASSNLAGWSPVVTNTSGISLFGFIENDALQFPRRFYRALVVP